MIDESKIMQYSDGTLPIEEREEVKKASETDPKLKELYNSLAHHTGKTYKEIEKDSDRDKWMRSEEAKEYGIIDEVLIKKS